MCSLRINYTSIINFSSFQKPIFLSIIFLIFEILRFIFLNRGCSIVKIAKISNSVKLCKFNTVYKIHNVYISRNTEKLIFHSASFENPIFGTCRAG